MSFSRKIQVLESLSTTKRDVERKVNDSRWVSADALWIFMYVFFYFFQK